MPLSALRNGLRSARPRGHRPLTNALYLMLYLQLRVMYLRKVIANRVHLGTELTVDEKGEATVRE
jgi:hypothetical protein